LIEFHQCVCVRVRVRVRVHVRVCVKVFKFMFGSIGIWTQVLALARQVLYHLNHTSVLFSLVTFCIRCTGLFGFCPGLAWERRCTTLGIHCFEQWIQSEVIEGHSGYPFFFWHGECAKDWALGSLSIFE
jgi:hypothetical protein